MGPAAGASMTAVAIGTAIADGAAVAAMTSELSANSQSNLDGTGSGASFINWKKGQRWYQSEMVLNLNRISRVMVVQDG